jgi:hypothetical protein
MQAKQCLSAERFVELRFVLCPLRSGCEANNASVATLPRLPQGLGRVVLWALQSTVLQASIGTTASIILMIAVRARRS